MEIAETAAKSVAENNRVSHDQYWDDVMGTGCRTHGTLIVPDEEMAEWWPGNFASAEGISGTWPWLVEGLTESPSKRVCGKVMAVACAEGSQ